MHMKREAHKLIDRFAVGALSGGLAFITSGSVLVIAYLAFGQSAAVWEAGLVVVGLFTVLMALLGFLLMQNMVASIFGRLWNLIFNGMGGIS